MSAQTLTSNIPVVLPVDLTLTPQNGSSSVAIYAHWAEGVGGLCSSHKLTGLIPVVEGADGRTTIDPDGLVEISITKVDPLFGEPEDSRLSQALVVGLVEGLRRDHGETHDALRIAGAVLAASPRAKFRQQDCPVLTTAAPSAVVSVSI